MQSTFLGALFLTIIHLNGYQAQHAFDFNLPTCPNYRRCESGCVLKGHAGGFCYNTQCICYYVIIDDLFILTRKSVVPVIDHFRLVGNPYYTALQSGSAYSELRKAAADASTLNPEAPDAKQPENYVDEVPNDFGHYDADGNEGFPGNVQNQLLMPARRKRMPNYYGGLDYPDYGGYVGQEPQRMDYLVYPPDASRIGQSSYDYVNPQFGAKTQQQVQNSVANTKQQLQNSIASTTQQLKNSIANTKQQVQNSIANTKQQVQNSVKNINQQVQNSVKNINQQVQSSVAGGLNQFNKDLGNYFNSGSAASTAAVLKNVLTSNQPSSTGLTEFLGYIPSPGDQSVPYGKNQYSTNLQGQLPIEPGAYESYRGNDPVYGSYPSPVGESLDFIQQQVQQKASEAYRKANQLYSNAKSYLDYAANNQLSYIPSGLSEANWQQQNQQPITPMAGQSSIGPEYLDYGGYYSQLPAYGSSGSSYSQQQQQQQQQQQILPSPKGQSTGQAFAEANALDFGGYNPSLELYGSAGSDAIYGRQQQQQQRPEIMPSKKGQSAGQAFEGGNGFDPRGYPSLTAYDSLGSAGTYGQQQQQQQIQAVPSKKGQSTNQWPFGESSYDYGGYYPSETPYGSLGSNSNYGQQKSQHIKQQPQKRLSVRDQETNEDYPGASNYDYLGSRLSSGSFGTHDQQKQQPNEDSTKKTSSTSEDYPGTSSYDYLGYSPSTSSSGELYNKQKQQKSPLKKWKPQSKDFSKPGVYDYRNYQSLDSFRQQQNKQTPQKQQRKGLSKKGQSAIKGLSGKSFYDYGMKSKASFESAKKLQQQQTPSKPKGSKKQTQSHSKEGNYLDYNSFDTQYLEPAYLYDYPFYGSYLPVESPYNQQKQTSSKKKSNKNSKSSSGAAKYDDGYNPSVLAKQYGKKQAAPEMNSDKGFVSSKKSSGSPIAGAGLYNDYGIAYPYGKGYDAYKNAPYTMSEPYRPHFDVWVNSLDPLKFEIDNRKPNTTPHPTKPPKNSDTQSKGFTSQKS